MRTRHLLIAATALLLPGQAIAEPLCKVLKDVRAVARKDIAMKVLQTGPELDYHAHRATRQIDGFTCLVSPDDRAVRTYFNCTTKDMSQVAPTIAAIGQCFAVTETVEDKSYARLHLFELQPAGPHMWIAAHEFHSGSFAFSLIAE